MDTQLGKTVQCKGNINIIFWMKITSILKNTAIILTDQWIQHKNANFLFLLRKICY